jgi:hypothetical protein
MNDLILLAQNAWDGVRPGLQILMSLLAVHPVETILFVAAGVWALQASGAVGRGDG